jgi:chaperonin GroES
LNLQDNFQIGEVSSTPASRVPNFFESHLERNFARSYVVYVCGRLSPVQLYDNSVLQMEECMHFRPLHDRVVVKRIDAEEKTAGGIIIPDTAKEKPQQGEIITVGPGGRDETGKLIPIDLSVGDRVLFGKWSGTEIKLDGVEYLIMKESDVMGVLEEPVASKKAA